MANPEPSLAERVEAFASSSFAFEHQLVYAVDHQKEKLQVRNIDELVSARKQGFTITLKSMEKFNPKIHQICEHLREVYGHEGPLICTVDICQQNSPALEWHAEPDGKWLKVLRGHKTIQYDNGAGATLVDLGFDGSFYISAGSRFRAVNKRASVMLVVKLGRFMEDLAL